MTAMEAITKADLQQLKIDLLKEIQKILPTYIKPTKQWLKSIEVRQILNISPGTLQTLRINGTLRFTKIGGTMYYKSDDLTTLLEGGESKQSKSLALSTKGINEVGGVQ